MMWCKKYRADRNVASYNTGQIETCHHIIRAVCFSVYLKCLKNENLVVAAGVGDAGNVWTSIFIEKTVMLFLSRAKHEKKNDTSEH